MAGDETCKSNGGKSDGNNDKVGRQATASNGKDDRRLTATRVMAMVTVMTGVMTMATRLEGNEEGKGEGGKGDGDGDDGGRRQATTREW